jgi:hypothetical protein
MAGPDVLDLHPAERPHCVYEQDEYDQVLSTFSLEKEKVEPKEIDIEIDPLRASAFPRETSLIERNVALFQVMLTRAQAALRVTSLTDEFEARSGRYHARSVRISALVQAQLHIARELRQWLKLLPGCAPRESIAAAGPAADAPKGFHDTMAGMIDETAGVIEDVLGVPYGSHLCSAPRARAWRKKNQAHALARGEPLPEVYGYPEDDPPRIFDPPPAPA